MSQSLDVEKLEREVKHVYRDVAQTPDGEFHFEMGRPLAEQLGYPPEDLDRIPSNAIDSFAGVGYHFDLAALVVGGETVDTASVSVPAGGSTTVSLGYTTYAVEQDVSFPVTVSVGDASASTSVSVTAG